MKDEAPPACFSPVFEVRCLRAAACDWRLSRGDVGVYAVVLKHCNADGYAFPGPTRIGFEARLAARNVKKSLATLEQHGYLRVIRPGIRRANRYQVLDPPTCPPRDARITRLAAGARDTRSTTTRAARIPQLGMHATHELASELTYQLTLGKGKVKRHPLPATGEGFPCTAGKATAKRKLTAAAEDVLYTLRHDRNFGRIDNDECEKRVTELLSLPSSYKQTEI